jgi:hypothetical protein
VSDRSYRLHYGQDMVRSCWVEGAVWEPYFAKDVGLLAAHGARDGGSPTHGGVWSCYATADLGISGDSGGRDRTDLRVGALT